jgi:mitochondrial import receptor subunit TOM40
LYKVWFGILQFLLMGTVAGSGVLTSRAQYRPTDDITLKYESRITGGGLYPPMFMGDIEYCGKDWNGQLKTGYGGFFGANYMQNISHHVSLGGEVFYLSAQNRSGVGLAARLSEEKSVSTLQVLPFSDCVAATGKRRQKQEDLSASQYQCSNRSIMHLLQS